MAKKNTENTDKNQSKKTVQSKKPIKQLSTELEDTSKKILEIDDEILDTSKKISNSRRQQLNLERDIYLYREKTLAAELATKKALSDQTRAKKEQNKQNDISYTIQQEAKKTAKALTDARADEEKISKRLVELQQKSSNNLSDEEKFEKNLLSLKQQEIKNVIKVIELNQKNLDLTEEQQKKLEQIEKIQGKISGIVDNKFKDVAEEIEEGIKNIPVLGPLLAKTLNLDALQEKFKEYVKDFTEDFKDVVSGASESEKKLMLLRKAGIIALTVAFVALVGMALELDKEVVTVAKSLDISKKEAIKLHHVAVDLSSEMHVVGVTAAGITTAMTELYTVTGYNVGQMAKHNEQAKDLLATTALLVQMQGLTAEEAHALYQTSVAMGIPMQNMTLMAESLGDELVSGKEIMKSLGATSKTVLFNLSKNPIQLVKAVKQAKLLGTTLDHINAAGDQLLNIESSLEAEMKANVLTGKHMNLNAAREAALRGDTVKLMEEIAKQAGSAAEYEKMAPFQRKAMAAALGLQSDELDGMMMKQKELESLGYSQAELDEKMKLSGADRAAELAKIADLRGEEARKTLEAKYNEKDRATMMDKLKDTGQKLLDSLMSMAEPVLEVLNSFTTIAKVIMPVLGVAIKTAFFPITAAFKLISLMVDKISELTDNFSFLNGITEWFSSHWEYIQPIFNGIATALTVAIVPSLWAAVTASTALIPKLLSGAIAMAQQAIAAISTAVASSFGLAAISIGAGIAAAAAGYYALSDDAGSHVDAEDAVIDPSGGLVVSSKKGTIQLHKDDSIIAGTNLEPDSDATSLSSYKTFDTTSNDSTSNINTNSSNQEIITLLKQLIAKVDQPVNLTIGSRAIEAIEAQSALRRSYNTRIDGAYGTFG
jgi:hypothetical protein